MINKELDKQLEATVINKELEKQLEATVIKIKENKQFRFIWWDTIQTEYLTQNKIRNETTTKDGITVRQKVVNTPTLSTNAKVAAAILCHFMDRNGHCWPSKHKLYEAGMTQTVYKNGIKELVDNNLLSLSYSTSTKGNRQTLYQAILSGTQNRVTNPHFYSYINPYKISKDPGRIVKREDKIEDDYEDELSRDLKY